VAKRINKQWNQKDRILPRLKMRPNQKRKSDISPNTQKSQALTSKFRKGQNASSLPTGEVNESEYEDVEFEDLEDIDVGLSAQKNQPNVNEKVHLKSPPLKLITFEVYKLNDKPFDGPLCREDRKSLWKEAGRNISEVQQVAQKKISNRCLQVYYKLKKSTSIVDISSKSEIEIELTGEQGTKTYQVRLPDFKDVETELGKIVTITAYNTIKVDSDDIAEWIELYGLIQGDIRSEKILDIKSHSYKICISHIGAIFEVALAH